MKFHCYVRALPAAPAPGTSVLLDAILSGAWGAGRWQLGGLLHIGRQAGWQAGRLAGRGDGAVLQLPICIRLFFVGHACGL